MSYKMIAADALREFRRTYTLPPGALVDAPGACDVVDSDLKEHAKVEQVVRILGDASDPLLDPTFRRAPGAVLKKLGLDESLLSRAQRRALAWVSLREAAA